MSRQPVVLECKMGAFPYVRTSPRLGSITSALTTKRWHQWIVVHEKWYFKVKIRIDTPKICPICKTDFNLTVISLDFQAVLCMAWVAPGMDYNLRFVHKDLVAFESLSHMPGEYSRISCQLGGRNWCEHGRGRTWHLWHYAVTILSQCLGNFGYFCFFQRKDLTCRGRLMLFSIKDPRNAGDFELETCFKSNKPLRFRWSKAT